MNQTEYSVFHTIARVGGQSRKQEETDASLVPVLSDMSSIMTAASFDSLDILSPRGTPMKHWLNCFYPSTKVFEVEEYNGGGMEMMVPSTISSLPPVAEVLRNVDTDFMHEDVELLDCDTNDPLSTKGELGEQIQEYGSLVLEGVVEDHEVRIESSSTDLNTLVQEEDITELDMSMEEKCEYEVISSVDFIFAFVWVVMSLLLLQGYTLSQDQVGYFLSTVMDMVANLTSPTTVAVPFQEVMADGFIHTTQLLNAVVGESVCSILGSSCIA